MKTVLWMTVLFFCPLGWAQGQTPKKVHPPYFLHAKDKLPPESLSPPAASLIDAKGQGMASELNIAPPDAGVMDQLSDPGLVEEIRRTKAAETTTDRFYWHSTDDLDYCHYQDMEGNHWYGWADGQGFNWVLWRGHRYWWHDPFAKHWLYYYQGYWWRADGQAKNSIQVCLDGEYYACDSQGRVISDMGQDGSGGIISAPGRYQGDMRHGNGGGRHGDGDHDSGHSHPEGGAGDGSGEANGSPGADPAGAAGTK